MEDKQNNSKGKKKKKGMSSTILIIGLAVVGLLVMLYPTLSNFYNQMTGSYAIQEFNENLADQGQAALEEQRKMAEAYNASLYGAEGTKCEYEYKDIMDFGNGMMGYIEMPVIDVYLPIYHSVDESVLSKGVGHIPKTAFPIGGEGNHSVLSGHTGLPSAELLTDLSEVKEGDEFYIHILGGTLAYEVDQILVVLPEEADSLLPTPGKDYCTLVTCTPYGVNSHRLLVRGTRVEYVEEVEETIAVTEEPANNTIIMIAVIVGIVVLLVILVVIIRHVIKNKKKKITKS